MDKLQESGMSFLHSSLNSKLSPDFIQKFDTNIICVTSNIDQNINKVVATAQLSHFHMVLIAGSNSLEIRRKLEASRNRRWFNTPIVVLSEKVVMTSQNKMQRTSFT